MKALCSVWPLFHSSWLQSINVYLQGKQQKLNRQDEARLLCSWAEMKSSALYAIASTSPGFRAYIATGSFSKSTWMQKVKLLQCFTLLQ